MAEPSKTHCFSSGWLLGLFLFSCMVSAFIVSGSFQDPGYQRYPTKEAKQKWNYVTVRKNAHMFWWLYYTTSSQGFDKAPLVMWLQGGPGGSSTGFGNFLEIGPLDVKLDSRNTTWLSQASLLFVDNPVGAGYSYVTSDDAYTTNVAQIAADLVTIMKAFLKEASEFKDVPFYIFSESYGGKMTAAFSQALYKAIKAGDVQCNFKGLAMGDSWISPIDSVLTWGPYLYATSLVDDQGLAAINDSAMATKKTLEAGNFSESTQLWSRTETVIESATSGVNFYNILNWHSPLNKKLYFKPHSEKQAHIDRLHRRHVLYMQNDDLSKLMNGIIREKLGIIPKNVTWGAQSGVLFQKQAVDFMKPVTDIVDDLLANTNLEVVVYSGQLDLIVDTVGTEIWVKRLKWPGLPGYMKAKRTPIMSSGKMPHPAAFLKKFKNFSFYWILDAGHMVPADAGNTALQMLKMVTQPSV